MQRIDKGILLAAFGDDDGVQLEWRRTIVLGKSSGMQHVEDGESGNAQDPGHGTIKYVVAGLGSPISISPHDATKCSL